MKNSERVMKRYKFTAKPRWARTASVSSTIIIAESEKKARSIARITWAMQGRLPNNTQVVEL